MTDFDSTYPDSNHDGIPDAFEHRPSITEILHDEFGENVEPAPSAKASVFVLRGQLASLQKKHTALIAQLEKSQDKLKEAESRILALSTAPSVSSSSTMTIEVEKAVRSANAGEWVLTAQGPERCPSYDHNRYRGYIIRRFL